MTVSLSNYITNFQYEINPPGQNLYPNMSNGEALQRLIDAFWSMRLSGLDILAQWTCDSQGNITPQTNPPNWSSTGGSYIPVGWYTDDASGDIGREIIQAIILFAHLKVLVAVMEKTPISTSNRAGPVESSTQYSAQVYQAALKTVMSQIDIVLTRLSDLGSTNVEVLDAVIDSTCSISYGDTWFVR